METATGIIIASPIIGGRVTTKPREVLSVRVKVASRVRGVVNVVGATIDPVRLTV